MAEENYQKTLDFLENPGTSFDDVFAHINWCMEQGREVAGGAIFPSCTTPGAKMAGTLPGDCAATRICLDSAVTPGMKDRNDMSSRYAGKDAMRVIN